jgi:hypothetical protein
MSGGVLFRGFDSELLYLAFDFISLFLNFPSTTTSPLNRNGTYALSKYLRQIRHSPLS